MDRRTTIREGLSALRHLRQLVRTGSVSPRDFARLTDKMGADLVAHVEDELLGFFEGHFRFEIDFHLVFPFLLVKNEVVLV